MTYITYLRSRGTIFFKAKQEKRRDRNMKSTKHWTTPTNNFPRKQAITMRTPSYSDVREHVWITLSIGINSLRHAGCFYRVPSGTDRNGWMVNLTGSKSGEEKVGGLTPIVACDLREFRGNRGSRGKGPNNFSPVGIPKSALEESHLRPVVHCFGLGMEGRKRI